MYRILLVEQNPQTLADILSVYGYDTYMATDGLDALQKLFNGEIPYDLVIMDLEMPRVNGWDILRAIRNSRECPDLPVILLAQTEDEDTMVRALRRGADDYLVKPVSPRSLLAHIEAVLRRSHRGAAFHTPDMLCIQRSMQLLTAREREILGYLVQGFSNQQIAERLVISETTVKNHLAHIFKKLKVSNRTQAAYFAQKLLSV